MPLTDGASARSKQAGQAKHFARAERKLTFRYSLGMARA